MFVKIIFVAVVVVFSVYADEDPMLEMRKMLHQKCVSQTGATEENINNSNKGNFENDDKLKCYMKCIFEELSAMDDKGVISADVLVGLLPAEMQEKSAVIIRSCVNEGGADACDKAFNVNKCFYKQNPQKYFLI